MTNPTNIWLGTALPSFKAVRVVPGPNFTNLPVEPIFQLGIGVQLFTFATWDATQIANTWNASTDTVISAITAVADDGDAAGRGITFTSNVLGADFDLICTLPNGVINSSSTYQKLVFDPAPSGGTFTLTVLGLTTGAISYSATPSVFAAAMQTAIAALSGFGATDVIVTNILDPNTYQFDMSQGQLIGLNIPVIVGTYTSLTGGNATVTVTVNQVGAVSTAGTSQVETLSFPGYGTHTDIINAVQTLATTVIQGSFTLTFAGYGTTLQLPYTSGRVELQAAMDAMFQIGNCIVTGGPLYWPADGQHYTVTFTFIGNLAGVNIPTMSVTSFDAGTNEIQQIYMTGFPSSGTFTLTYSGQTTAAIAYNSDATAVQAALIALSNIGPSDIVCSGGPLIPGGSPATADTVSSKFVLLAAAGPISSSSYNIQDPPAVPCNLMKYTVAGLEYQAMLKFPVSGYVTACTFQVVTDILGNAYPPLIDIADLDNASIPLTYADFVAAGFTGAVTSPVQTTAMVSGHTVYIQTYDITAILQAVMSRQGWRSGNNVVLRIYMTNAANQIYFAGADGILNTPNGGGYTVTTTAPKLTITQTAGTYGPINLNFQGALAFTNLSQTTVTDSVTAGTVVATTLVNGVSGSYTPTAVVTGGSATVNNISGGTFSLVIDAVTVPQIPYNVTSTALAILINTAFNATVCTVTGGPAPGTPLVITFAGTLGLQPVTVTFLSSLTTNLAGSMTDTIVSTAVTPYTPTNKWNMVVCPGNGTLGVNSAATVKLNLANSTPVDSPFAPISVLGSAVLKLSTLSAILIEATINELLSDNACRVAEIGHSLEHADIQDFVTGQYSNIWYMVDTYQICFTHKWEHVAVSIHFSDAYNTPSLFMTPNTAVVVGDAVDQYPEDNRVANAFVALAAHFTPIHLLSVVPSTATVLNNVAWRYKLIPQWDNGNENHSGYAGPLSGKIQFVWGKQTISATGTTTFSAIQTSAVIDWDASASLIQTTLSHMFFGANVIAEGTLHNSWLSESLGDAPVDWYQDLKVFLSGIYYTMPLDDYGYTLQCVLLNQTFAAPTSFQKDYLIYGDYISRTIPPHINRRESVSFASLSSISSVVLGLGSSLTSVQPTATAAAIQAAIDAMFPASTAAAAAGLLPEKYSHQLYVYGTNWSEGAIDFEFSGGCCQQNTSVSLVISPVTTYTIGQVVATTPGVLGHAAVDALQTVHVNGSPTSGTFTLTWGGHTTSALAYNISLSSLQTAVTTANFSSPTITGDVINGFLFTWAGAGGPRATITTAASLNNVSGTINITNLGGLSSTFYITEVEPGAGPSFGDTPANWSLGRCPNTLDNLIFDDSPAPLLYGLEMVGTFVPQVLSTGVVTIFSWNKNRKLFRDGQHVVFTTAGTPPTGLINATTYVIANSGVNNISSFTLKTEAGVDVKCSSPGSGTFLLTIGGLNVVVYSRFAGGQIGLPHIRIDEIEPLPQYFKAGFDSIRIGVDAGAGLALGAFDCINSATEIIIEGTAKPADNTSPPSVLLKTNNAAATLEVDSGNVGLAFYSDQTAVIGDVKQKGGSLSMFNTAMESLNSTDGAITLFGCTINGEVTIG